MNDVCCDWMLVEDKRPLPPAPIVEAPKEEEVFSTTGDKRMSDIERKLLGVHFILEKERQSMRKSVILRKKEEEEKLK
jgi:hypothetical protein